MAKERDWVDYVNLGSNLVQNAQLSGLQNKLSTIEAAAATEQAKSEQEDQVREIVFQADTHVRELRAAMEKNRAGILALTLFTVADLERHDINSARFRRLEDKEKLRSVLEDFKALASQCRSTLSKDEQSQAELCVKYMLSPDPDPDIEASVPVHLKARLAEAEKQLQEISGKEPVGVAGRLFAIILIGTPLSLAGLVMFIFGGIDASSRSGLIKDTLGISAESVTHWGLFLLLLCGVPVVIIMLADWKIKNGLQFRKQMAEASTSKKLKIDEIREIRSDIEKERERIGSDLERIRQERSALMARVLQGHHTDSSPPDRTSVPDPSKTKFDVVLLGLPTDEVAVLTVIKAVSELNTKAGKGMMEAFLKSGVFTSGTLSRTLPMTVLAEATKQDAENAQIILEAAGAKVVLR